MAKIHEDIMENHMATSWKQIGHRADGVIIFAVLDENNCVIETGTLLELSQKGYDNDR